MPGMSRFRLVLGSSAAALTLTASAHAAPLPAPTEAGRFALDRSLVLPSPTLTATSPIIGVSGGIREGGISALQVVPGTGNRRFIAITDRGPNGQPNAATGGRTFPSPSFAPTIMELQADADGRLSVVRRLQIRVPGADPLRGSGSGLIPGDTQLITGFRNVVTSGIDDRTWLMTGDTTLAEYLPTDPYGMDTEGVAVDPRDGSYWVSDEYPPVDCAPDAPGRDAAAHRARKRRRARHRSDGHDHAAQQRLRWREPAHAAGAAAS